MLTKHIEYGDGMPLNITIANIENYPIHIHDDLEIIYVVDGSITLRNGYYDHYLEQDDIFVVNAGETHSFEHTGENNKVLVLHIDLMHFSRYYKNLKNCFFVTDSRGSDENGIEVLRENLARIMMESIHRGKCYDERIIDGIHNIIVCLLANFNNYALDNGRFINVFSERNNRIVSGRISRITDYMYSNYNRKMTLNELAEREHLSINYLSHMIKDATGMSFQDLLSYFRVRASEEILLSTRKSVSDIAALIGFSAARYYVKHFSKWFGMHPEEYRKTFADRTISGEEKGTYTLCTPAEIKEAVRRRFRNIHNDYIDREAKAVIVDIDVYDDQVAVIDEAPVMGEIMKRPANAALAEPYERLMSMEENIIASGENYLVTTRCDYPGALDSLSILIYNFDEKVARYLKKTAVKEQLMHIARLYDEEIEFLFKGNGLMGEHSIIRYRLNKEHIIGSIHDSDGDSDESDRRGSMMREMASRPVISKETITCSEVLSVRSMLKGVGAELILIDKN